MKHLYLQTAFLGDLLLSIPTLKALRDWDKEAEITLLCRKGLGFYMKKLGLVQHIIEVDKGDEKEESWQQVKEALRGQSFDYLFSPHMSTRSHFLARQIKAGVKVGYKRSWNFLFYDVRIQRPMHLPEALRQLALLAPFDESLKEKITPYLEGKKTDEVPFWASMTMEQHFWASTSLRLPFNQDSPYICMAPGSVWNTKRWTKEGFVGIGQSYAKKGFGVVILGAPEEESLCQEIQSQIPGSFSLAGKINIWESTAVLSLAQLMICNDSGAMHLASIAGTPTVALFGPTVLDLGYEPWQSRAIVVENKDIRCRPCGKHGHKKCPIGTHECMTSISWQEVSQSAEKLLDSSLIYK